MPLTRSVMLGLLCFTFSALAFDEVGDILVTAVQTNASANSTIKCDRALPIQSSHLAYIRTGTNVVVGRYAATYDITKNVTAAQAATGDGSNSTFDELTLEARNGSALVLTLTDKDGGSVCVYDVRVLEGSVMGLKWADGVPHAKDPPPKKSDDKPPVTGAPKDEGSEDGSADDGEDPRGDQQDDSGGSGEDGDQSAGDAEGEEEQEQPVKPVKKGGKGKGKGNTKKRDEEEDTDAGTDTTTNEGDDGEQAEQEQKPVKKPPVTKGGAAHGTKGAHKGDGDESDEPAPKSAATRKGAPGQNAKGKGNGGGDAHSLRARVKGKGEGAHTGVKPKPKHKVEDEETEGDNEVRRGLAQAGGGNKGQGQSKGKPSGEEDGAAVEDVVDDAPQPRSKPKPKQGKDDKPKQQDALSAEQKREERMYANAKLYEAGVLQVSVLNTTRSSPGAVCNGNSSGSSQQLWVGQLMAFARFELPEGVRSRLDEDQGGWEGNQPKGLWPTVSEPRRQDLAAAAGDPDKEAVEVDVGVDSVTALRMHTGRDGDKGSGLDGVNWNDVGVRERKGGHGPEESTPTAAHWEDVPVPIVQTPDGHLEPLTTTNEVDPGQQSPPEVNWEAETSVIFGQGVTNVRKNELSASIGQAPVGWHLWKLSDGLFVSTERVKQGNTDGSDVPGGCVFAVNVVNGTVFDIQAPNAQPPTAPAHAARFLRSS